VNHPICKPAIAVALFLLGLTSAGRAREISADVCVYGATPSGILAAIAVQREGRHVMIVEPSRWVGGILGAGLKPTQDCPNIHATGGLTRTLLTTLGQPVVEKDGKEARGNLSNSALSPADIRKDFLDLLQQHDIRVVYDHRVSGCDKGGPEIRTATFDLAPFDELGCPTPEPERTDSLRVTAKIFIDATYEGDLMARACVSYRVGRESAEEFGEELAGVRPPMEEAPIDPFVGVGVGIALTPPPFSSGLVVEGAAGIRLVPTNVVSIMLQARYLLRWTEGILTSGPIFEGGILINF